MRRPDQDDNPALLSQFEGAFTHPSEWAVVPVGKCVYARVSTPLHSCSPTASNVRRSSSVNVSCLGERPLNTACLQSA
jgi:hypothetical protein